MISFNPQVRFGLFATPASRSIVLQQQPAKDTVEIRFGRAGTLEEKARRFAQYHDERIYKAELAERDASFAHLQHGGDKRYQVAEAAREATRDAWKNTRAYNYLQRLQESGDLERIADPVLRRELELLTEKMKPNHPNPQQKLEDELALQGERLDSCFSQYQAAGNKEQAIGAWKPAGSDETYGEMLLNLVGERNRFARTQGFDNYYSYELSKQGFNEADFTKMVAEIKKAAKTIQKRMEKSLGSEESHQKQREWDKTCLSYLRKLEPEEVMRRTAGLMGQPIENILNNADLYIDPKRPEKTSHYFCSFGDLPHQVRPITNIPRNPDERQISHYQKQLLHEVIGHGLDLQFIDADLPPLLRDIDAFNAEAQAVMFESLVTNETWLQKVLDIPDDVLEKHRAGLKMAQLETMTRSLGWQITRIELERDLYANPGQDLDAFFKKKFKEGMGSEPAGGWEKTGAWANFMHYAKYPVYLQNYMLGEAWRAQVEGHINREFGSLLTPEAGAFLKKHRSQGKLVKWPDQIQQMTGKPLNANALVNELRQLEKAIKQDTRGTAA